MRLILARRIRDEGKAHVMPGVMTAVDALSPARHYIQNKGTVMRSKYESPSCRLRTHDGASVSALAPSRRYMFANNDLSPSKGKLLRYGEPELLWSACSASAQSPERR